MSWHFVQGCSLLNLLVSEISRIQVGVVLSCLSVAVLMTRAFWLSSSLCKDGSSWGPETCGTGAGHESRTFLQADEVARHQCCVYWVVLRFLYMFVLFLKCWMGWHCKCKQMAQGASAGLQSFDVHRRCMSLWSCHAFQLALSYGSHHITSKHLHMSTLKPRWEAPLNLLLVVELPLLFMYFGYLNWTGQGRRTGPQSRSGVGNTSMAPFQTLFTGLFKHTFFIK